MRLVVLLTIIFCASCSEKVGSIKQVYQPQNLPEESNLKSDSYLKLHLKDGRLVILNDWILDTDAEHVSGGGYIYDPQRHSKNRFSNSTISFEDCVMAETNDPKGVNAISPIIMTFPIVIGVGTFPCLFDPKACFGSCPTFYSLENDSLTIQAEGFSSSITRSLEDTDIDYLRAKPSDSTFSMVVKNEAYETHYISSIDLLAFPLEEDEQILKSQNAFYQVSGFTRIDNPEGNEQIQQLTYRDGNEYFSPADSIDLTQKETMTLSVSPTSEGPLGVVITERQSLMTTFLFYQSLAYMGNGTGSLLAAYEIAASGGEKVPVPIKEMLGGIEVEARVNGKWQTIGELNESGPIVSDTHLLPIEKEGLVDRVRLTMVKGLWRIDEVSLVHLGPKVKPVIIPPKELIVNGHNNLPLLEHLRNPTNYLVNMPGAEQQLNFNLPEADSYQLFLRSKGYYVEWMREEWLQEEDPKMVRKIFLTPRKWLKEMAPKYKQVEPVMEELFWSSKFATQ